MDLVAATDTIIGSDGPLTVILGTAMMLVFAGLVVRSVLRLWPRRRARSLPSVQPAVGLDEAGNLAQAAPAVDASAPQTREQLFERQEPPREVEAEPPQLSPETLAPFARTLERSRRLVIAERRVLAELSSLPKDEWLVEQQVLENSRRIPFMLAGPTGLFVVCVTDGRWTIGDLEILTALADRLQRQLPGWDGEVQVVMVVAFDTSDIRFWAGGKPDTPYRGWVLGIDDLTQWLRDFESEHGGGLARGDIRRLNREAVPDWDRHRPPRLPKTPNYG